MGTMVQAYWEDYLEGAQDILGHAFDFAINTVGIATELFETLFTSSDISKQFEIGSCKYVAGYTGPELAREIITSQGLPNPNEEDIMYMDKTPEYWAGWALAYYQWFTGAPYKQILRYVPLKEIIAMYSPYHEMDITQFCDTMNDIIRDRKKETNLERLRCNHKLTQAALAEEANVPPRQIQLFEQRQRDINKAEAITLLKLSRVLKCHMEDLIEIW